MTLSETAHDRLGDVRELEPTSNGELRDRWGMDSGSDVHRYLEEHLSEYVTRGDDGKIRVDGEPPQMDSEPTQGGVGGRSGTTKPEDDPQPSEPSGGAESPPTVDRDDATGDATPSGATALLEEEQDMIDAAAEAGYESGFEEGRQAARSDDAGDSDGGVLWVCPSCGDDLEEAHYDGFETAFTKGIIRKRNVVLSVDEGDLICRDCDVLVDVETRKAYPGSEYDPPA